MSTAETLAIAYSHLIGIYRFQSSNYALFVYDHILTFSDEVEKIWKQPFTFPNLLFYMNRYMTHCQYFILNFELHQTDWPIPVYAHVSLICDRFIKFAGAITLILIAVADLTLILRVYALYFRNKYILVFLLSLLAGQIIFTGWGVHFGIRVPLPHGFPGCLITSNSRWFTTLWAAPLVTDSFIFLLTIIRAASYRGGNGFSRTVGVIIRDGTLYFLVIFGVNLMNCLIYLLAEEDLKATAASFSQILTSILISRLQLNLRQTNSSDTYAGLTTDGNIGFNHPKGRGGTGTGRFPNSHQMTTTFFSIGNLGEETEGNFLSKDGGAEDMELPLVPL